MDSETSGIKIFLGSDHAGFELKEKIKKFLEDKGFEVEDKGAYELNPEDDYPDFILPVAEEVSKNLENVRGIILGGSGQGEAMAANKIKDVRAAIFYGGPEEIVKLSREHNNSNILSLGARFLNESEALKAVEIWLEAKFEGGRHERRLKKIDLNK